MNRSDLKAFHVNGFVEGEAFQVIGRCGDSAIRVGDVFSIACRYQSRERLEDFANPPTLLDSNPVSLRVQEIRAYGRILGEIGPGMTGSLVLAGTGAERIVPGTILEMNAAVPATA